MSLEQNTDLIREKTAGAADLNKKVKFDLKEDGIIHVDNDADVTLILSMENFEALVDGSLNPQMAFMMGKLKIEGDMGLALKLADIF